jgi:hypothetical protein
MAADAPRPLLLPQNRKLRHLKGIYLRNVTLPDRHVEIGSNPATPTRPKQPRRRSTIWAGASPLVRQKKLEDVIDGHMIDVFFSLHVQDELLYVSEVVERAMVGAPRIPTSPC